MSPARLPLHPYRPRRLVLHASHASPLAPRAEVQWLTSNGRAAGNPSFASRRRPPAICISAARAPRSSTGSTPRPRAAASCCASRTPIASATIRRRSPQSSTGSRWLELDWEGEPVSQFARATRHREVAEAMLAAGNAYRCYLTPQELDEMRKAAEAEKRPLTIRSSVARSRSDRRAGRRALCRALESAARGRDRRRRPRAGPRRLQQQGSRRPHHPAERRQPHLQSRRRRRRPRHGDHARHPRRRPPDECRAPDADLPGHGLGRPGVGARAADPRPRRSQALETPRRARRRGLPRDGLSAGGAAQLSRAPRLEPRRRRDHVDARSWSNGSISTASTRAPPASTSRSSRT